MAGIRHKHLRLVVYPNDHPPPHCHVVGPGWEIRVELSDPPSLMTIAGKPKVSEIADALIGTAQHLGALLTIWSDLYD